MTQHREDDTDEEVESNSDIDHEDIALDFIDEVWRGRRRAMAQEIMSADGDIAFHPAVFEAAADSEAELEAPGEADFQEIVGQIFAKGVVEDGDDYHLSGNDTWEHLKKYVIVVPTPHIREGYAITEDGSERDRGDRELVFKVPCMVEWAESRGREPPEDSDAARIIEYLTEYWEEAYGEDAQSDEICRINPMAPLVYAIVGRHADVDDPSVVFRAIRPITPDDHELDERFYGYEIAGELSGSSLEFDHSDAADRIELELKALLQLFVLNACVEDYLWERVQERDPDRGFLPPAKLFDMRVEFDRDQNTIVFEVELEPQYTRPRRDEE